MARIVEVVKPKIDTSLQIKRVCAYARVSTGKESMLHSLSAQVSYYQDYIQSHPGWQFCGIYADAAYTGTKENRTQFQKMLSECRDGNIDLIVTKSISRFARNTITLLQTVRELKNIGVEVYFEEQDIYSLSTEGEVMLTILASYAQEESRSVSENMKWRYRKGFENGELCNLHFIYGYSIKKGVITIDPEEAEIVKMIYARFLNGASLSSITRWLNKSNIPSTLGGNWYQTMVRRVLSNEKYTGNALLQKTYVNNHLEKKQVKNNGELPQFYVEDSHPAIIDQKTYDLAQVRLSEISEKAKHVAPTPHPFTSRIVCKHCGKHFKRIDSHKRAGWRCISFSSLGKAGCEFSQKIPEDLLLQMCAEVLGLQEFDERAFRRSIDYIEVSEPYVLEFVFKNGRRETKRWRQRKQSEYWTEEMKQRQSKIMYEYFGGRKQSCQK